MIKLATIGTSGICEWFLKAAKTTDRFVLEAVYSRSDVKANAFAEKYGFNRCFTDLNKMAADPLIDAVYIASPNSLHFEQTKLFLENRKHVICEKPIVLKPEELTRLQSIAKQNGVILMEALISVHTEQAKELKNAALSLGKIKSGEFIFSKISSRWSEYLEGKFINVFEHSMGGGALYDLGVYPVYAAVFLFGEPIDVKSENFYDEKGNNLYGKADLVYNGFSVKISYSKSFDETEKSRIFGEHGEIEIGLISMFSSSKTIIGGVEADLSPLEDRVRFMAEEATDFADYIAGNKLDEYDYFNALAVKVHAVMEKIYNGERKKI